MRRLNRLMLFTLIVSSLAGCSRFEVSVNKRVVYEPPKLFSGYSILDRALKECVRQSIEEQNVTKPSQLTKLACPEGEIENLSGIEIFSELELLDVGHNKISIISPIAALKQLRQLNLEHNQINDASPLGELEKLEYVNLSGNPAGHY